MDAGRMSDAYGASKAARRMLLHQSNKIKWEVALGKLKTFAASV